MVARSRRDVDQITKDFAQVCAEERRLLQLLDRLGRAKELLVAVLASYATPDIRPAERRASAEVILPMS